MLSTMQKQMESQQLEMIRLYEAPAHAKEAIARIHTRLLKQIGMQRTDSPVTTTYSGIYALLRKVEAQPAGDLRRGYGL